MPLNIIKVVCRSEPGIATSTFNLYFGAKGTMVLHNKDSTVRSGGTVAHTVGANLHGTGLSRSLVLLMRSADERIMGRVVGVRN